MTLKPDSYIQQLDKHADRVLGISVTTQYNASLVLIKPHEISAMIDKGEPAGEPRYASVTGDIFVVFPKPDQPYKCQVLSMLLFEQ